MKITHAIWLLLGTGACSTGTTTAYPSSSGAMGVGSNVISSPSETPEDAKDSGEGDTGVSPEDSGR